MEIGTVIIGAIVYAVVVVLFGIFFVGFIKKYRDPDDLPDCFTTFITWLTYLVTTAAILLLPFDVICAPDSHEFMPIIWQIFMGVVLLMIVAVVPFTICYYEQEGFLFSKICTGLLWMIGSIIVWALIIVVFWVTLGYAEIPVDNYMSSVMDVVIDVNNITSATITDAATYFSTIGQVAADTEEDITLDIRCSFVVYAVCIVSILGWVFFLVFGGGGVFTLPFDWILACIYRPRIPTKKAFVEFKAHLKRDTEKLLEYIEGKKRECTERIASDDKSVKTWSRKEQKELKNLKLDVDDIIDDYDHVRYVSGAQNYNVLVPYLKLVGGIFFLLLALVITVQIVYIIITKKNDLLGRAFTKMDEFVPFLGAGFYGVVVLYLAVSTIKGSVKIGTKFLLIQFYPMHEHATLPNAMLFNGLLYMASSLALMQFANTIFEEYTYNSAVNGMFAGQIQNVRGLKYVFRYLHLVFLGCIVLGFLWSITFQCCIACCTRHKKEKRLRLVDYRK